MGLWSWLTIIFKSRWKLVPVCLHPFCCLYSASKWQRSHFLSFCFALCTAYVLQIPNDRSHIDSDIHPPGFSSSVVLDLLPLPFSVCWSRAAHNSWLCFSWLQDELLWGEHGSEGTSDRLKKNVCRHRYKNTAYFIHSHLQNDNFIAQGDPFDASLDVMENLYIGFGIIKGTCAGFGTFTLLLLFIILSNDNTTEGILTVLIPPNIPQSIFFFF